MRSGTGSRTLTAYVAVNCLIAASEWAKNRDVGPVDFVFDKDGKLGSRALDLYRLAANFPSPTGKFRSGVYPK